jgi:hypothetical protein
LTALELLKNTVTSSLARFGLCACLIRARRRQR